MEKEYFLFVQGERVVVTKEVYLAYWQVTNHENQLNRNDRQKGLLYAGAFAGDGDFLEQVADESMDVERIVETAVKIESVREALTHLTPEERDIIDRLYFQEETLRGVADVYHISHPALLKRRNRILQKLKKYLTEF